MNLQTSQVNALIAILHIKEAAKLLETSNLEISKALYEVAMSLIEKEQISNDDIIKISTTKLALEKEINQ